MFQLSYDDMVKGIRRKRNKEERSDYIENTLLRDIHKEIKGSADGNVKATAIKKLIHLRLLGVDMSFASFAIVQLMSVPVFGFKRIAMLAATQSFSPTTDVLLLSTNTFRKDLRSPNIYESGVALNCLSNVVTPSLARDLADDVAILLSHSKPYARKKAIICLYKVLLKNPASLIDHYDRLTEKLNDPDISVVSCAVNVICELSRTNPKNFLPLAPRLFELFTTSSNNWMLIKIVKLMSSLLSQEPRLARKLLEPLANIIQTTMAKSLLYECIFAVAYALRFTKRDDGSQPTIVPSIVKLCTIKLREFVEDNDQNLKYLGLVGFIELMESHPHVMSEHKDLILKCLLDPDIPIRLRAVDLLIGMVTHRNLVDIVQKLLEHVIYQSNNSNNNEKSDQQVRFTGSSEEILYRDKLVEKIIQVCSKDQYSYLPSFPWYLCVLIDLSRIDGTPHGDLIASQILNISIRVPSLRDFAAQQMSELVIDGKLSSLCISATGTTANSEIGNVSSNSNKNAADILLAAAWISCEYYHPIEKMEKQKKSPIKSKKSNPESPAKPSLLDNKNDLEDSNKKESLELIESAKIESAERTAETKDVADKNNDNQDTSASESGEIASTRNENGEENKAEGDEKTKSDNSATELSKEVEKEKEENETNNIKEKIEDKSNQEETNESNLSEEEDDDDGNEDDDSDASKSNELFNPLDLVNAMLNETSKRLPEKLQVVFIHGVMKIARFFISEKQNSQLINQAVDLLKKNFVKSEYFEVQERAVQAVSVLELFKSSAFENHWIAKVFETPLAPVHPAAQQMVQIPSGLDLTKYIIHKSKKKSHPSGSTAPMSHKRKYISFVSSPALSGSYSMVSGSSSSSSAYHGKKLSLTGKDDKEDGGNILSELSKTKFGTKSKMYGDQVQSKESQESLVDEKKPKIHENDPFYLKGSESTRSSVAAKDDDSLFQTDMAYMQGLRSLSMKPSSTSSKSKKKKSSSTTTAASDMSMTLPDALPAGAKLEIAKKEDTKKRGELKLADIDISAMVAAREEEIKASSSKSKKEKKAKKKKSNKETGEKTLMTAESTPTTNSQQPSVISPSIPGISASPSTTLDNFDKSSNNNSNSIESEKKEGNSKKDKKEGKKKKSKGSKSKDETKDEKQEEELLIDFSY